MYGCVLVKHVMWQYKHESESESEVNQLNLIMNYSEYIWSINVDDCINIICLTYLEGLDIYWL